MARPPARLRAKLKEQERKVNHFKKREQKMQAMIEQLTLKVQRQVHNLKEKFRKKSNRLDEKENAAQIARVQRMSQIKSLEKELSRKDEKIAVLTGVCACVIDLL